MQNTLFRSMARTCVRSARLPVALPSVAPWTPVTHRCFAAEAFLDKSEALERIMMVVSNFEKVDPSKVKPDSLFKEDLDLDSLDAVEVVMAIEEEFALEIPDGEADKILSIDHAVEYISAHPQAK